MKIAVVGATGGVGRHLVTQALGKGWDVIAPARNPDKLQDINNERLQVIKADLFDESSLTEHLRGCNVVVSSFGHTEKPMPWGTASSVSNFVKVLTSSMESANVNKLVIISSWCTVSKPDNPKVIEWFIKPLFLKPYLNDLAIMEDYVMGCENISYSIVKPPQLTTGPLTESEIFTSELEYVPEKAAKMSKADTARFMLTCVESEEWNNKKISITVA